MAEHRRLSARLIVAGLLFCIALALIVPVAYIGAYFAQTRIEMHRWGIPLRMFHSEGEREFFDAAWKIEKWVRGERFGSGYYHDLPWWKPLPPDDEY